MSEQTPYQRIGFNQLNYADKPLSIEPTEIDKVVTSTMTNSDPLLVEEANLIVGITECEANIYRIHSLEPLTVILRALTRSGQCYLWATEENHTWNIDNTIAITCNTRYIEKEHYREHLDQIYTVLRKDDLNPSHDSQAA